MTDSTSILVVEDDANLRMSIRAYLDDYDYEVFEAADGKAGLKLFEQHRPAVVLVDLKLPGIDGMDVLHAVRQQEPETAVIVISGTGNLDDVVQALRIGAWDFLSKPIDDLSLLRYAIARAMERARLLAENRQYREHLEQQVRDRTAELQDANESLTKKNIALEEVLDTIESRKNEIGKRVVSNIEKVVLPLISSLRPGLDADRTDRLEQIEQSLREVTSPFAEKLTREAAQLSPTELRIAMLIIRGMSAKEIAAMEFISPETVSTHRRSIRRKLGITNSKVNLASYLEAYLGGTDSGSAI